jgi:threonine/homoserine efflux transporter RhtA
LWLALGILGLAALLVFRRRRRATELIGFALVLVALIAIWLVLGPRQTLHVGDAAQIQALIGQGKPVLLEFQSPF